ncbi:MAG TPA: HEPN domain-containing protein [Anaerolineae bacterium]|nr:HEPN domain-containing protein [Anaerolineae bacterium]
MDEVTMKEETFDAEQIISYWLTEAQESLQVAEHLVEKRDYSYALFFGHLAVEKILKAIHAAKRQEHAPPIHNLLRLAKIAGLEPNEMQAEALLTITAFNIEARYPDLKRAFRQQCTPEYTQRQLASIKEIFVWLRSLLP